MKEPFKSSHIVEDLIAKIYHKNVRNTVKTEFIIFLTITLVTVYLKNLKVIQNMFIRKS